MSVQSRDIKKCLLVTQPTASSWTMSSTYADYQGPSSLPSEDAILSRLSTNYDSSTPEPLNRPLNSTIGVYPHNEASQHLAPSPTETSPLLDHPPVPQIEENIDYNVFDKTSTVNMFWEELAVLTKYAVPVVGYAPSSIFHES